MFALVTGTTNGIGKSVTSLLLSRNLKVLGVDKRLNNTFKNKNYIPNKINILNKKSVYLYFLKKLKKKIIKFRNVLFFLNAGINIYDNDKILDMDLFRRCFEVNFFGVMNFVDAIEKLIN